VPSPQAIVLFARSPEREAAAKRIPAGATLFRSVVQAWLHAAHAGGATPIIACESRDRESLSFIAPDLSREWIRQEEGPFGRRVARAVVEAFERGFESVIIAAIDAPPPADLGRALQKLREGVSVVAPARDGGINFIGLVSPETELLEQFHVRRRDLVDLCRRHLRRVVLFGPITDIDAPPSIAAAARERSWQSILAPPRTHAAPFADVPLSGMKPLPFSRPPPR
jgi:glycosyltransferase A (GT-A) superfamily protein (DUF2064 family)